MICCFPYFFSTMFTLLLYYIWELDSTRCKYSDIPFAYKKKIRWFDHTITVKSFKIEWLSTDLQATCTLLTLLFESLDAMKRIRPATGMNLWKEKLSESDKEEDCSWSIAKCSNRIYAVNRKLQFKSSNHICMINYNVIPISEKQN